MRHSVRTHVPTIWSDIAASDGRLGSPHTDAIAHWARPGARADVAPEAAAKTTFAIVLHNVLEDVQQRLVYRVHAVATDEISRFAPKAADVDYPNLLTYAALLPLVRDLHGLSPIRSRSAWGCSAATDSGRDVFPTVATTIGLLGKLYRCVNVRRPSQREERARAPTAALANSPRARADTPTCCSRGFSRACRKKSCPCAKARCGLRPAWWHGSRCVP